LTISSASSTPTGLYTANVTGDFGPLLRTASVKVTVTGFILSASPYAFSFKSGSSASSTISLISINGFGGTVNLGVGVSPSGPSVGLNATKVTLASGGLALISLTISTTTSTAAGFYTANITGLSGLQVHSLFVPVAVGPISVSINNLTTFTGVTVRTNGTLTVDSPSNTLTLSGLVSVNATDATTHAVLFSYTYNVTRIPILTTSVANYKGLFLLDISVSPYPLSSDVSITFSGTAVTTTVAVTRNVDIDLDGVVNGAEVSIWSASNGCSLLMSCYNPRADFYATGTVNLIDLALIASYYNRREFLPINTIGGGSGGGGSPPLRI
jgi:hypothetical protein